VLGVAVGLQAPRLESRTPPAPAMMEIRLLRRIPPTERQAPRASALPTPSVVAARPALTPTPSAAAPAPSPAPAAVAVAPAGGGEVGCAPEVLMLLTAEEKTRCRDQIAIEAARKGRPDREAREAAAIREARAQPTVELIPVEKRAYYDALVAAKKAIRPKPGVTARVVEPDIRGPGGMASKNTNIAIGVQAPRCKLQFGPNKPKHRPKIGEFKLGFLPCYFQVPQGSLTEEVGVEPP